ncbi:MAG: hypothetical protein WA952_02905 [Lewinella sp.]
MTGSADPIRTLTFDQLIDLLEHAHQQAPEEVVAIWNELERRGVARHEILERRRARVGDIELHKRNPRGWITQTGQRSTAPNEQVNTYAWQENIQISTDSIIDTLTGLMGMLACLQIYGLFFSGLISLRPAESVDGFTLYITLVGCGAAVFCLLAALRLWQRRRIGWVLSFAYLLFQWLTPVWDVIRYTLLGSIEVPTVRSDQSFWHRSIELFLAGSLLYGPALYFIFRARVRKQFNIREGAAERTLLVTCAVLVAFKLLLIGG